MTDKHTSGETVLKSNLIALGQDVSRQAIVNQQLSARMTALNCALRTVTHKKYKHGLKLF